MSNPFASDGFAGAGRGRGAGQGWPMSGLWEAMEQFGKQFEQKVSGTPTRMGKGDVRAAVLALLVEKPMHGYQIIREIEDRSGGSWKPSPGSVYPTLQLLADEGLIRATESEGRKTYSLTDEGREVAGAETDRTAPWEASGTRENLRTGALPKAGVDLAQAVAQVGRSGNPEQVKQAVDVLDEARRKIFSILAQD
ncbi:PadR family transcriptional regulator [Microbacterium sp. P06]|uniref:PadR family transcriptional regulator n=1 Tax=Microbacterium sp. P06 TaxID=3366949 RepID=UPI0037471625